MRDLIYLASLLIIYCFFHSFLISLPVMRFIKNRSGFIYYYYRIIYNIFSVISLIPIIYYAYILNGRKIITWIENLVYLKYLLTFAGLLLLFAGAKEYSLMQFTGLKQIILKHSHKELNSTGELKRTGVLGIIRHPWYTAGILLLWSRDMDNSALVVNIVLTLYLIIGAYLEEYKLVKIFGNQYCDYKKEVSMLFPYKWIVRLFFHKNRA